MKKLTLALFFTGALFAQTATFTFGAATIPTWPYPTQTSAAATFDNGQGGTIWFAIYPYGSTNLTIPQAYGFPNNGYLTECATFPGNSTTTGDIGFSTPGFTINPDGVTAFQHFTANNCYDGGNSTISVDAQFERFSHTTCGHGRCTTTYTWHISGGKGTVIN